MPSSSQGPLDAGNAVNDATVGTVLWQILNRVFSNDGQYTTASLAASAVSEYINTYQYGFSIPTTATITGIVLTRGTQATQAGASGIVDNSVKLYKAGVLVGSDKATATSWGGITEQTATYGTSSDLWGTTWAPADINATNFGAGISAKNTGIGSDTAELDYVELTVYYTLPASLTSNIVVSRPPQATYQFLNPD